MSRKGSKSKDSDLTAYYYSGGVLPDSLIKGWRTDNISVVREKKGHADQSAIYISPFEPNNVEPCSLDLRVGEYALRIEDLINYNREKKKEGKVDELIEISKFTSIHEKLWERLMDAGLVKRLDTGDLRLKPHELTVVWTEERFALPLVLTGLVTTKINLACKGILQITSRIDPGFGLTDGDEGRALQIPIYNASSNIIKLSRGDKFSNIVFIKLAEPAGSQYTDRGTRPETVDTEPYLSPSFSSLETPDLLKKLEAIKDINEPIGLISEVLLRIARSLEERGSKK